MPVFSNQEVFEKRSRKGIYFLSIVLGNRKPVFENLIFIKSGNPKWKELECKAYWGLDRTREILKGFVFLA